MPTVTGRVVDAASGVGVAGVELTLRGVRTTTGESGEYRFFVPRTTADTLRARRLGFASRTQVLSAAAVEQPDVALSALPNVLSPTVVRASRPRYSGRLAGFYERLEKGTTGQFITREELAKDRQGLLSHVLQHAPGVQVRRGRGVPVVSLRGRDCRPLIWIDGVAMTAGMVDLDSFSPRSLQGVELYLGSVSTPQRFQGTGGQSECGAILLWSRGPDTDPVGAGPGMTVAELERLIAASTVYNPDDVDVPAVVVSGDGVPQFPPLLRASRISGSVTAEFVVDTNGRVDTTTIGFATATHPAFAEAVRTALVRAAFRPAQRGGRPVRQLVRQRFAFDA